MFYNFMLVKFNQELKDKLTCKKKKYNKQK